MQPKTAIFQSLDDKDLYLVVEFETGKIATLRGTREQAEKWLDALREEDAQVGAA